MAASVETGDTVSFSGDNSYDSDGSIVKYEWIILGDNGEIKFNQENFNYIFNQ